MKFFVVLAALVTVSAALPQYNFDFESVTTTDNYVNIPEGCTFISSSKEIVNGRIEGEYSYKDPVGSIVTVTYSVGTDGKDYTESRKIIKKYQTDRASSGSGLITAEQVVLEIITDLEPTVISIIKQIVASANVDLSATDGLVNTIMIQLRPVVEAAVTNALRTSSYQHLDATLLISEITLQLRPFVEEALRREIVAVVPTITEAEVVELVINQLRDTIITVIRQTVAGSSDASLNDPEGLVQTIIIQLNPVVLSSVQNALAQNPNTGLNAQSLTQKIIIEITPFVRSGVTQQIEAQRLEAQRLAEQRRREEAARLAEQKRREEAARLAEQKRREEAARLAEQRRREEAARLAEQRRQEEAARLAEQKRREEAARLAEQRRREEAARLAEQRRQQEAARLAALQRQTEEVVTTVITQLEPIVIKIVRATVRSANVDLNNYPNLVETIMTQLQPVVLAEVQRALQTSQYVGLNAQTLTTQIVVRLRPFVETALKAEIEAIKKEQQINPDELIERIIVRLEPIVIRVIETTVRAEKVDLSNTQGLVDTIIVALKPVVLQEVEAAIQATGATYLNAQELTVKIIERLRPFVLQGVQKEVKVIKQQSNNGLVQSIIKQLTPHVITSVEDALGGPKLDAGTSQAASSSFLAKMRSIIKAAVVKIMRQNAGLTDQNKIISLVMAEFRDGYLLQLITDEVQAALGGSAQLPAQDEIQALLDSLRGDIRRIVIEEIGFYQQANSLSASQQAQIMQTVISILKGNVVSATNSFLSTASSGVTDQAVVSAVSGGLRNQIVSIISREASGLSQDSDAFRTLMARIMAEIRTIIIQTVQAWRAEQARLAQLAAQQAAAAQVQPAQTAVTSIFGTGDNNIKVKTNDFNFSTQWN